MAGVESLEASRAAVALERHQYRYAAYRTDVMHWLCKPSPALRTHHLHLVPLGSPLWTDVNGDNVAEYQVSHDASGKPTMPCTYPSVGCELNITGTTGVAGWGSATSTAQDPNLKRAYQNKINVGISHELLKGVSISAEWFHTTNGNIQQTLDTTRLQACGGVNPPTVGGQGLSASDAVTLINCNITMPQAQIAANPQFQAITVYSPIDGHAVTVYDLANAAVNAVGKNNFTFTDNQQTAVYNGFDIGFNARLPRGGRMFGGTTTERQLNNTCDTAAASPNSLLYCDQSNLGGGVTIPWKTQIKLAGSYPLPWWGLIVNGAYQGLPGYTEGATTYSVTKGSTKYTTCPGNSVAAGCVVGALIAPTALNSISATLDPSGTTLTPRTNQVDFGIAKRLKFGRIRIDPKIDMFNALNSDDYYSVTSTTFSPILNPNVANNTTAPAIPNNATGTQFPSFRQPSRFLQGRIFRIGANITW